MVYDAALAEKIREYLSQHSGLKVEEKKMFRGLAFMVNGKMCVNVSGDNLMCRFDPDQTAELLLKVAVQPMIMKGKKLDGYCYVEPAGFKSKIDFEFWIDTCLAFNDKAKASRK
jgi:hypothetical protein